MCHSVRIRQRCHLVSGKAIDVPLWGHCPLGAPGYRWSDRTILIIQGQTEEYLTGNGEGGEGQACLYQCLTRYLTTMGGSHSVSNLNGGVSLCI